jgi:hypothetical protein
MHRNLMEVLEEKDLTGDRWSAMMDRFFWLSGGKIHPTAKESFTPATLTLWELDRLVHASGITLGSILDGLDDQPRPLPDYLWAESAKRDPRDVAGALRQTRLTRGLGKRRLATLLGRATEEITLIEGGLVEPIVLDFHEWLTAVRMSWSEFLWPLRTLLAKDSDQSNG